MAIQTNEISFSTSQTVKSGISVVLRYLAHEIWIDPADYCISDVRVVLYSNKYILHTEYTIIVYYYGSAQ